MNTFLLQVLIVCCSLLVSHHQVHSFSIGGLVGGRCQRGGVISCICNVRSSGNNDILKTSSISTRLFSSSNDKKSEIAALEERLRRLKEEENAAEIQQQVVTLEPDELGEESEDSIMFSEKWKEGSSDVAEGEGSLGGIAKVGLAIGFVAFLALFSQIPVGSDELQKYQDVKGSSSRIDLGDLNPGVRVQ